MVQLNDFDLNRNLVIKKHWGENVMGVTTLGLKKQENEDVLGFFKNEVSEDIRLCIADGHWGSEMSKLLVDEWLNKSLAFPESRDSAITATKNIELSHFEKFGKSEMNSNTDLTPEASFTAIEINKKGKLTIVSYGDCRLLVFRQGKVIYRLKTIPTWLGAFSYLGMRNRLSVAQALIFDSFDLQRDDLVLLYTDGVDECVYETPTLGENDFLDAVQVQSLEGIADELMAKVFSHGAEDNASLIIYRAQSSFVI